MFFNTLSDKLHSTWNVLDRQDQIDEIIAKSFTTTQIIFKHSVACGISAMAKHKLEIEWETDVDGDFYYLDLIANRSVSNAVADRLGVIHQSPQIILIKDGKAIDKVSHHAIQFNWIKNRLVVSDNI